MNTEFQLQPRDEDGPVFKEPWESLAFAMVLNLQRQGVISPQEWATTLGQEIRAAQAAGDPDTGIRYYHHWLRALEKLAMVKAFTSAEELIKRKAQWREAYLHTPHGHAVTLPDS